MDDPLVIMITDQTLLLLVTIFIVGAVLSTISMILKIKLLRRMKRIERSWKGLL